MKNFIIMTLCIAAFASVALGDVVDGPLEPSHLVILNFEYFIVLHIINAQIHLYGLLISILLKTTHYIAAS